MLNQKQIENRLAQIAKLTDQISKAKSKKAERIETLSARANKLHRALQKLADELSTAQNGLEPRLAKLIGRRDRLIKSLIDQKKLMEESLRVLNNE